MQRRSRGARHAHRRFFQQQSGGRSLPHGAFISGIHFPPGVMNQPPASLTEWTECAALCETEFSSDSMPDSVCARGSAEFITPGGKNRIPLMKRTVREESGA